MKKILVKLPRYIAVCLISVLLPFVSANADTVKVSSVKANVYVSTSSSQVIDQKLKDDEVEVVTEETSWYKIKLDDETDGWIKKSDIAGGSVEHTYSSDQTGKLLNSYSDETIKVSIENIDKYYVTKIWLQNPELQVKKAEAGWGQSLKTVNTMLNSIDGAIVGCNGSGFYKSGAWSPSQSEIKKTSWDKTTEGYLVISNGEIRRMIAGQSCNALLGILPNGSFKYYENNSYNDVINDGVKDTFTFGPLLIKDGVAYKQKVGTPRKAYTGNPRQATVVGQIDENNFILITPKSTAALNNITSFGLKMGCKFLYNMDGGGSSTLWFRNGITGNGVQVRKSDRKVGDALYFVSLKNN